MLFDGLFIASLFGALAEKIKEDLEPTISAEQWGNKELIHQDIMNGVSVKEQIKNAQNGKYFLKEKHQAPHRDSKTGQIIIENTLLYKKDLAQYGAPQTYKWVQQGKYNLTSEELQKEKERIKKHLEQMYGL